MKKNLNITSVPTVNVVAYTKPAPQTPQEIVTNAIPAIAVTAVSTAVTTAVAGLIGALVNRITRPRVKHVPVEQVQQILDDSEQ